MSRIPLDGHDIEQMLRIARPRDGVESLAADEALPWELVHDLKALVPCDMLSVSGQDTPRWEFFADQELPKVRHTPETSTALAAAYRQHYWTTTCSYPDRSGDLESVWRVSDMVGQRELRDSGFYVDFMQPSGVEHEIMLCLEAGGPQRTLRLLFARGRGSDFSERDLAILTLLRPHLQEAYIRADRTRHGLQPLTERQREILHYVAAGYSNTQVARRMDISAGTVGKHLENIFARLGVTSRAAAVARMAERTPTTYAG